MEGLNREHTKLLTIKPTHAANGIALTCFDPAGLSMAMSVRGISTNALVELTELSRGTVIAAIRGRGIYPRHAALIAQALAARPVLFEARWTSS